MVKKEKEIIFRKNGNSFAITIPPKIKRLMGFNLGDVVKLTYDSENKCCIIKKSDSISEDLKKLV